MGIAFKKAAVIGATGPTGIHLAGELVRRQLDVRVVSRSLAKLERAFAGGTCELLAADALDRAAMNRVVTGCDLVIDCIGLPPDRMADHEVTARNISGAASAAGARCLQVSSFWGFLPMRRLPLDETHPRQDGNAYARARRAAEDVMLEAGAAVVHLPDFFGPFVHGSTLQQPLQEAAAGKTMNWIGAKDTKREYVYVPDAMAIVADLLHREEAYGSSWVFPGSGPLDGQETARIAGEHLGRPVKLRAAPRWLLRGLALVSADLRAFVPILDDYLQPMSYDAGRLETLLGPLRMTPYGETIPATLDWLAARDDRGDQ